MKNFLENKVLVALKFKEKSGNFAEEKLAGRTELVQYGINTGDTNSIGQLPEEFGKHEEATHIIYEMSQKEVRIKSNSTWSLPAVIITL